VAGDALMPFRLRERWLMFDASVVKEVLGGQQWLVVPQSSRGLLGLCAWRGRAIPVLDMLSLLGLGAPTGEPWQRTLVLECAENIVAVPVNEARAVVVVGAAARRARHVTALPFSHVEVDDGRQVMSVIDVSEIVRHLLGQVSAGDGRDGARAVS
jgi:chemotaxis signal transduction protein